MPAAKKQILKFPQAADIPKAKLERDKQSYDAMSVAPTVKKTIVIKDLFSSGQTAGKTFVPKNFVVDLYNNTRQFTNKFHYPIPIQEGHADSDQALKGRLLGMELQSRKSFDEKGKPTEEKVIVGKFEIYNSLVDKYNQGLLPGLSIGINPEGFYTAKDKKVGEYIYHVALLGKDTPAIPHLMTHTNVMAHGQYTFSMQPTMQVETEEPLAYAAGDDKKEGSSVKEVIAMLEAIIEKIKEEEVAEGEAEGGDGSFTKDASSANGSTKKDEGEGTDAGAGNASTDMKKEYALIEAKMAEFGKKLESVEKAATVEVESETAFATLFNKGLVVHDEKNFFKKQVKAFGLADVLAHYEKRPSDKPPLGQTENKSNRDVMQTEFQATPANVYNFSKAGYAPEEIAEMVNWELKAVQAAIKAGGK